MTSEVRKPFALVVDWKKSGKGVEVFRTSNHLDIHLKVNDYCVKNKVTPEDIISKELIIYAVDLDSGLLLDIEVYTMALCPQIVKTDIKVKEDWVQKLEAWEDES